MEEKDVKHNMRVVYNGSQQYFVGRVLTVVSRKRDRGTGSWMYNLDDMEGSWPGEEPEGVVNVSASQFEAVEDW